MSGQGMFPVDVEKLDYGIGTVRSQAEKKDWKLFGVGMMHR